MATKTKTKENTEEEVKYGISLSTAIRQTGLPFRYGNEDAAYVPQGRTVKETLQVNCETFEVDSIDSDSVSNKYSDLGLTPDPIAFCKWVDENRDNFTESSAFQVVWSDVDGFIHVLSYNSEGFYLYKIDDPEDLLTYEPFFGVSYE